MAEFATDKFDEAILALVQGNNQQSHSSIGAQIGLSASAVRRRLHALRQHRVIEADVALVNPTRRGLSFIVQVYFDREDPSVIDEFLAAIAEEPCISQCYSTSGDCDFWLLAHAPSPEAYERWAQRILMANPHIRRYTTSLVWSRPVFRALCI